MDLKVYFHKVKTIEATLSGEYIVLTPKETEEEAHQEYFVEVTRANAAKLMAQGKMRQATEQEAEAFKASAQAAKEAADEQARVRLHFGLGSAFDLPALRSALTKGE